MEKVRKCVCGGLFQTWNKLLNTMPDLSGNATVARTRTRLTLLLGVKRGKHGLCGLTISAGSEGDSCPHSFASPHNFALRYSMSTAPQSLSRGDTSPLGSNASR